MPSADPSTSLYQFPGTNIKLSPRLSCSTFVASLSENNTVGMDQRSLESNCLLPNLKIIGLINEINKMAKNPLLDSGLSKVLEAFLAKIRECNKYLECGILNLNFAEAALLVKSSGDLYGKRVDLLWDVIFDYQKRMISQEKNVDRVKEIEKLEERRRKYKRKRKTNDVTETTQLINSFSFGNVEFCDYLHEKNDSVDLSKEWMKFKTSINDISHPVIDKKFVFLPDSPLYNADSDYIGKYSQFHSTMIIDEIFHLEQQKHLPETNCVSNIRIDTYIINDFLHEKQQQSRTNSELTTEMSDYINNALSTQASLSKELADYTQTSQEKDYCKESFVCQEKLASNVTKAQLRRVSLADSLFDEDPKLAENVELETCTTNEAFSDVTKGLEVRSKSCSQDSAFYEDYDHNCNDSDEMATEIDENHNENNLGTIQESVEEEIQKTVETKETTPVVNKVNEKNLSIEKRKSKEVEMTSFSNRQTIIMINLRQKQPKNWSNLLDGENDVPKKKIVTLQKRHLSQRALQKLATGVTVSCRNFESFFRTVYKAAEGEGVVPEVESYESDGESSSDDETTGAATPFPEETSDIDHNEDRNEKEPEPSDIDHNEDRIEKEPEPSKLHKNLDCLNSLSPIVPLNLSLNPQSSDMVTSTPHRKGNRFVETDFEREETSRKTITEWRNFIIPKIKTMENRADFNIHEYGAAMIDSSQIGEERSFKDLVKGKNTSEVARCFIATLQLANTRNIEISGAVPGKLSNDSFKIKTIDKTRHHELLEEYQAPSEETFEARMKRAKSMNPKKGAKRPKLTF